VLRNSLQHNRILGVRGQRDFSRMVDAALRPAPAGAPDGGNFPRSPVLE
jgi:hypothetical protein